MRIKAQESCLLIVDVQERLAPVMADPRRVLYGGATLMRAALRLSIPIMVTEQYPKGLGPTMIDLRSLAPEGAIFEKVHFASTEEPGFLDRLKAFGRRQVVMAGIESHICVTQTALGLLEAGYEVFVVADACSSRQRDNYEAAMRRLGAAGATLVTVEMAVFEWLFKAGTPEFKDLSAIIK
ncbi:MAG: hydrolase [Rhodospirillales bacterium]|nr:hydrolase [Rhodospirillales bacterium]